MVNSSSISNIPGSYQISAVQCTTKLVFQYGRR